MKRRTFVKTAIAAAAIGSSARVLQQRYRLARAADILQFVDRQITPAAAAQAAAQKAESHTCGSSSGGSAES